MPILRQAKACGVTAATIFLAQNVIPNTLAEKLGLADLHKELLMLSVSDPDCEALHRLFDAQAPASKKAKPLVFSIPFKAWPLSDHGQHEHRFFSSDQVTHHCIITIVDQGRGKACIRAARAAGVRDALLIHGRGAGVPADYYFPLVIEPQKDIIMVLAATDRLTLIRDRIFTDLGLDQVGSGILFTLPVDRPRGLFENRQPLNAGVGS